MGYGDLVRSAPLATVSTFFRLGAPVATFVHTPTGVNKGAELRSSIVSQLSQLEIALSVDSEEEEEGDETVVDQYERTIDALLKRMRPFETPTIPEYLVENKVEGMFPLVSSFYDVDAISDGLKPARRVPTLEEYLKRVSHLSQLVRLSKQLLWDVQNLDNHKYVAHQVAVLYQTLNKVIPKGSELPVKSKIEDGFGAVKGASEAPGFAVLPQNLREWVVEVTSELLRSVYALKPEFASDLAVSMQLIRSY
eukprot:m51a1_g9057 hypothetical protein (251) ;mRNA; r:61408-62629